MLGVFGMLALAGAMGGDLNRPHEKKLSEDELRSLYDKWKKNQIEKYNKLQESKGLKKFSYDEGIIIYAINKKNADRKYTNFLKIL